MSAPSGLMSKDLGARLLACRHPGSHGSRCGVCDGCAIDKHIFATTQPLYTRLLRLEQYTQRQTRRLLAQPPGGPIGPGWDLDKVCPGSGTKARNLASWYEVCPVCDRWIGKGSPKGSLRSHYRKAPEEAG